MEAISGAGLGVALQRLHDSIVRAIADASKSKFKLQLLQTTVTSLINRFNAIEEQQKQYFAGEEAQKLRVLLVTASHLVSTRSKIPRWNFVKKRRCRKRLDELHESLKHLLTLEFQLLNHGNILKILSKVNEMNKKLEHHCKLPKQSYGVVSDQQNSSTCYHVDPSPSQPYAPTSRFVSYERRREKVTKFRMNF